MRASDTGAQKGASKTQGERESQRERERERREVLKKVACKKTFSDRTTQSYTRYGGEGEDVSLGVAGRVRGQGASSGQQVAWAGQCRSRAGQGGCCKCYFIGYSSSH